VPAQPADVAELRFAFARHVDAALVVLDERGARVAAAPAFCGGEVHGREEVRVVRAVDGAVVRAAAGRAGFVTAAGAAGDRGRFVDVAWWDPGCAGGLGTIDALAGGDESFFDEGFVAFLSFGREVGEDGVGGDFVEAAFWGPLVFGGHGGTDGLVTGLRAGDKRLTL
jgi:hypothetical protein